MLPSRSCLNAFKDLYKNSMARVCSQAMILTAGCQNKDEVLHGMTVSSVCSLSAYPAPLLQFNLHLPSYTSQSLHRNNGLLCLHLMPPTQRLVYLSRTFASGIKRDPEHFDVKPDDGQFHEMTTPFSQITLDGYKLHELKHGLVPVLNELETAFICSKKVVFNVDNHEIWVVDVLDILAPNEKYTNAKSGGLLYFDRGFHQVGPSLRE